MPPPCEEDAPPPQAGPRIRSPGLLLLGAAGRNAGKTTLACRILQRLSARLEVTGVKITTVREGSAGECPRGGEGCGVCRSFDGPFLLTEERDGPPEKDTVRMLRAGARRVLWLRVHRRALRAGIEALLETLGPGTPVVAESNTARVVLDPDLFLMLRRSDAPGFKASARAVRDYADRTVVFDGKGHDLDPRAIEFADGRWRLDEPPTAIVLAGGSSRRMGFDKRSLAVDGVPLLERVVRSVRPFAREVLVVANPADPPHDEAPGTRLVFDRVPGRGPLMGVVCGLAASTSDRNLVAACDLPDIPAALVRRLLEEAFTCDAAVPRAANGNLEPLLAVYRRRLLPDAERLLAAGAGGLRPLLATADTHFVPLEEYGTSAIPNLNTPEDLRTYAMRRDGPRRSGNGDPADPRRLTRRRARRSPGPPRRRSTAPRAAAIGTGTRPARASRRPPPPPADSRRRRC